MRFSKNICIYGITLFLALTIPAVSWAADKNSSPWKKYKADFGVFVPVFSSGVALDSKILGKGPRLSLEDDLNLDSELNVFRAEVQWRFFPNHRLEMTYYDISRSTSLTLDKTLQFGELTYPIGINASFENDLQIFKISYTWFFLQTRDYELGVSLGANVMDIDLRFSAAIVGEEGESVIAPIPAFGLRADYAFTPKFILNTAADFFYLDYKEFEAHVLDLNIDLEYYFLEHSSLSLGYSYFDVEVSFDAERRGLVAKYSFHGPKAAVSIRY